MRLAKQKNDLYLLVKKYPGNDYLKSQYKKMSKRVQLQTSTDKKNYFGKLLDKAGLNSRKYWRVVGQVTGREIKSLERITINSVPLDVPQNQKLIANEFNKFFIEVTQQLSGNAPLNNSRPLSKHLFANSQANSLHSFFMNPISTSEIFNAIQSISSGSSVGTDGITSELVKTCVFGLLSPLEILFNFSITEGVFPDALKSAIIVPVFKAGSRTELSNYRPIAILSVISKIFELIIKNRMLDFLNQTKFFNDRQYGFLPGRCTDDALLSHITDITSSIERKSITASLYLDISKAFDTVDHSILLDKLHNIGFRGSMLNWFETYLKNRIQMVRVGSELSSPLGILSGVPQGSTLGPTLFLIYVNDLLDLKISGRIYSFADDTSILFSAKSKSQLLEKINSDTKILSAWFWAHKLHPNLQKTKIIAYGHQKIDLSNSLKLHTNPYCPNPCSCSFIEQVPPY